MLSGNFVNLFLSRQACNMTCYFSMYQTKATPLSSYSGGYFLLHYQREKNQIVPQSVPSIPNKQVQTLYSGSFASTLTILVACIHDSTHLNYPVRPLRSGRVCCPL